MNARPLFLCLLLFCGTIFGEEGLKPSEMKTKDALHAVINGQLAAFRKDDYAAAYVFADQVIKNQFPVESFERMVRAGYPAIAHSTSAKCGLSFDNGDEAVVNVRVFSENHDPIDYQYTLHRDGQDWRITGVTLLKDQTTQV